MLEVKQYMRPTLTKDMNVQSFKDYYWLKEDLKTFCSEHGMNDSGSKVELADRIELFLRTGVRPT
jgi:hypothetical protein